MVCWQELIMNGVVKNGILFFVRRQRKEGPTKHGIQAGKISADNKNALFFFHTADNRTISQNMTRYFVVLEK